MTRNQERLSALSGRIRTGQADLVSSEEREIVAGLRRFYDEKFGRRERPDASRRSD